MLLTLKEISRQLIAWMLTDKYLTCHLSKYNGQCEVWRPWMYELYVSVIGYISPLLYCSFAHCSPVILKLDCWRSGSVWWCMGRPSRDLRLETTPTADNNIADTASAPGSAEDEQHQCCYIIQHTSNALTLNARNAKMDTYMDITSISDFYGKDDTGTVL